jgi:hypothetical protein
MRKIIKYSLKIFFVALLLFAIFFYYTILGPMPWKDSKSRYANKQLRSYFDHKQSIKISELFQTTDEENKQANLLVMPAYAGTDFVTCTEYSANFLKNLNIETAHQDGLCRFVLVNPSGAFADLTLNTRGLFCNNYPPPLCMPLNEAFLIMDEVNSKACYKIANHAALSE